MRYTKLIFSAATASATTIYVRLGENGTLVYSVKALVGDNLEPTFHLKNHAVTQSSFAKPYHLLEAGFFSTLVSTTSSPSGTIFTLIIKYCGQVAGDHCRSSIVAAINAPTNGDALSAFRALAKNVTTSTSPPINAPIGGVLFNGTGSENSAMSSNSSSNLIAYCGVACAALALAFAML